MNAVKLTKMFERFESITQDSDASSGMLMHKGKKNNMRQVLLLSSKVGYARDVWWAHF